MRSRSARAARSPGSRSQTDERSGFLPRPANFHREPTRNMKGAEPDRRVPSGSSVGLAARQIALEILIAVERRGSYADAMLGTRVPALPPPDRRLTTRLVLGTIAWRARLDYELERFCGRDLAGIQAEALTIMRMGLLQIRFLDRIAPHAAVSTSVELAKRSRRATPAAGFVNAVMRRATREKVALPLRSDDEVAWLAIAIRIRAGWSNASSTGSERTTRNG